MKLALIHQYDLVPVYSFGESKTYRQPSFGMKFRLSLNKFGFPGILFPHGWRWFPVIALPDAEIVTVVGEPIELPKLKREEITKEVVAKWHGVYIDGLKELFQREKKSCGVADDVQLEIW